MKRLSSFIIALYFICTSSAHAYEVFPIATGLQDEVGARVSGNTVVWHDERNGNWDIYAYDLATRQGFSVCTKAGDQVRPNISGNYVVWEDRRSSNSQIYGYDLTKHTEFLISATAPEYRPQISGNMVVWSGWRSPNYGIWGYDMNTKTEINISLSGSEPAYNLDIHGNQLVWEQYIPGRNFDILGYNVTTHQQSVICSNAEYQYDPATNGQVVLWQDRRKGNAYDMDIYGYNLTTHQEFAVDTSSADSRAPDVDGNLAVWVEGGDELYGFNLDTKQKFLIASGMNIQYPDVNGSMVVWTSHNGHDFDIYGVCVPEPSIFLSLLELVFGVSIVMTLKKRRWR
jgi:TolB protein